MPNDDNAPTLPKTAQLPVADRNEVLLAELKVLIVTGLKSVREDFGSLESRVGNIEGFKEDVQKRLDTNSMRARGASQIDMEQAAQLVQERAARETLATKVDGLIKSQDVQLAILSRLDRVASNPSVKIILAVAATAFASWAASKGLR